MRKDSEKRMEDEDLPTFDDFIKFLENELRILESTAPQSSSEKGRGNKYVPFGSKQHSYQSTTIDSVEKFNYCHLKNHHIIQVMDSCGQFRNVGALLERGFFLRGETDKKSYNLPRTRVRGVYPTFTDQKILEKLDVGFRCRPRGCRQPYRAGL
ncbi:hypothetical protein EVAR_89933_1 [Eumeta japonica]|uniref:Uncharacterized protein n=1 Tax=Eumeta variegata TaxID=151549 RepID=A0A4C1XQK7_EUMVA|nr:hypothetical protein EVAR_89933_1 [Eumeta japonica]